MAAVALALVLIAAFSGPAGRGWPVWLLGALGLVAGIGWWDDHRPLPASSRLLVHLLAGVVLACGLLGTPQGMGWLVFAGIVLSVASLVNIWNFMDGINGLSASQAALAGLLLVAGMPAHAESPAGWLALVVGMACLGFLPFNFPRARVFLGDVGSGSLGLLIAAIVWLGVLEAELDWRYAVVVVSAFLLDAGLTLAKRVLQGRRWWKAHREHLYQWGVRRGLGHPLVTFAYAIWTLLAATVYLSVTSFGTGDAGWYVLAGVLAIGAALWGALRGRLRNGLRGGMG